MSNKASINIPLWASFFTLCAFLVLVSLGTWQVKRLSWKNSIIDGLNTAYEADFEELTSADFSKAYQRGTKYIKGYITGRYMHNKEIVLGPRTHKGLSGYHVITPFKLQDGKIIFINRGWIPPENKDPDSRRESLETDKMIVLGLARPPEKKNYFTPANEPSKNNWFSLDMNDINTLVTEDTAIPYIFYAKRHDYSAYTYPLGHDINWLPPNNHLQYALFWYLSAFILLIIYYLRFFKKDN
jgi:surfeit locus 1 family protein